VRASAERVGPEVVHSPEDLDPRVLRAVAELGFERDGEGRVRRFHAGAAHTDAAAERFPLVAEKLVRVELRVRPLELQLRAAERRGLGGRAESIREALR